MIVSEKFQHKDVTGFKFGRKLLGTPKMHSHIYYVDGMLIDTGQSRMRDYVLQETKNLKVDQIFLTHHHEDHTGNVAEIRAQHGCPVYASEECSQLMKNPPTLSPVQKITWGRRDAFHEILPVSETIKTNKYNFQLIPIPGHAPDMLALYEPDQKWLFSADLFINTYIGYFLEGESIAQQIDSTRKVLELDFKELFCSHNPRLHDGREKLIKKLRFLENFYEDVSREYKRGLSTKEIFKALELQENWAVRLVSGGKLSKLNMVKSVIANLKNAK